MARKYSALVDLGAILFVLGLSGLIYGIFSLYSLIIGAVLTIIGFIIIYITVISKKKKQDRLIRIKRRR
jgi:hypothetical protein